MPKPGSLGPLKQETRRMAEISGVRIVDVTAFGSSDDGEYVWITHRLGDGSSYPLVYPYEAVGYLVTALTDAARSAYRRRAARNPREAVEGMNSDVIPIEEVRVGTAPDKAGAVLHLTTADNIPIAVELPAALLGELLDRLASVAERLQRPSEGGQQLH
jgi:hypothetical protein